MIRSVRPVSGAIPLTKTKPAQQWVEEWSSQLYVRVTTSRGAVGWGEVLTSATNSREPYLPIIRRVSAALLGQEEADPKAVWSTMRRLTFSGGYGVTTGAISGIDIALWDAVAREKGVPLSRLLGGSPRKVMRYASLSRYQRPEDAVRVVGYLLDAGYSSIKLHQTGSDSLETIRKTRAEYGMGFDLMADLNCALPFQKASEFMREVQRHELKWVEEPVWPPDDFESLEKLNRIGPVAAGENFFSFFEFKRLMEAEALSYYQPDVMKVGGVTPTVSIIELAKKRGAKVALHCRPNNGWVGTIASAHLASALLPSALVETPPNGVPSKYFHFTGKVDPEGVTPGTPGLGIAPKGSIPKSNSSKLLAFH